jgi:hypothetical protein
MSELTLSEYGEDYKDKKGDPWEIDHSPNDYPPQRVAHDCCTSILYMMTTCELSQDELSALNDAMNIARKVANS